MEGARHVTVCATDLEWLAVVVDMFATASRSPVLELESVGARIVVVGDSSLEEEAWHTAVVRASLG